MDGHVATSKNKKQKKKKIGGKNRANLDGLKPNGIKTACSGDHEHDTNDNPEPETPTDATHRSDEEFESNHKPSELSVNSASGLPNQPAPIVSAEHQEEPAMRDSSGNVSSPSNLEQNGAQEHATDNAPSEDTDVKSEILAKECQALQDEVAQLRKSLENLQEKHQEDANDLKAQLEESQNERDHAQTQYRTLLGRVNTIKSQFAERLRADAVCMHIAFSQIYRLQYHRKILPKLGAVSRNWKGNVKIYEDRMKLALLSCLLWPRRGSNVLRNYHLFETAQHYHSKIGQESERTLSREKHMRRKNLKQPSKLCKTGKC